MLFASRNHALGFAERTRKNLQYIENASSAGADVHVVTQLANSLLGLIVFPWEKDFSKSVEALQLDDLVKEGWPKWEVTMGSCQTLGQLMRYLRNAVAHGNVRFSSESRSIDDVTIEVENFPARATAPNWSAHIEATRLREFCLRFIDLVEERLG